MNSHNRDRPQLAERVDRQQRAFHSPWLPFERLNEGERAVALVQNDTAQRVIANRNQLVLPAVPGADQHPLLAQLVNRQWYSQELFREARQALFSLYSSYHSGWVNQVHLVLPQLLELYDRDRISALVNKGRELGIPVEHIGRGPLVEDPFPIRYDGAEWLIHPLNDWEEIIPFEAHKNKAVLERAGIQFDHWLVADEVPPPTLAERARDTARFAGRGAAAVLTAPIIALAAILGPGLGALAIVLDPALVGALVSKAEPDKADWFIISRWYH